MHVSAAVILLTLPVLAISISAQKARIVPPEHADEQDSLKCAMATLYRGILADDAAVIRALLHVENDANGVLVEAHARRIVANVRFVKAARQFDLSHNNVFVRFQIFHPDDFGFGMLPGDWDIQGVRANLPPQERMGGAAQPAPPTLINVKGVWKVDLTPVPVPNSMDRLVAAVNDYTAVVERTAADISEGKLRTAQQITDQLAAAPEFAPAERVPALVLALPPESTTAPRR